MTDQPTATAKLIFEAMRWAYEGAAGERAPEWNDEYMTKAQDKAMRVAMILSPPPSPSTLRVLPGAGLPQNEEAKKLYEDILEAIYKHEGTMLNATAVGVCMSVIKRLQEDD